MRRAVVRTLSGALLLLAPGCARETNAPAPAVTRPVDNPSLGVRIADLPQPFEVVDNSPSALVLSAGPATRVEITVDDREAGVNVVEEAKRSQAEMAARPAGRFAGGNELVTPFGSAYTVRGSWERDGVAVEQRLVYLPHPDGSNRLVTIAFDYPPGTAEQARERLSQTLELIAALGTEDAAAPAP